MDADGHRHAKQSILRSNAQDGRDDVRADVQPERPIRRHRDAGRAISFILCCEINAIVMWTTGVFNYVHGDEDANGQAKSLCEHEV